MNDENENEKKETSEADASEQAMLSEIEARILGALMEKQLTTPDQYPLTLNSLVTACNQKTSREPVSSYSKGDVENCVNKLRERKLIDVEYGSRANRFDQRLSRTIFLDKPIQALVTILLLRGPQTVSELLNRTERMTRFENSSAIEDILNTLCQKTSPIVTHIPRQSGQREDRYMHLLCGKPDLSAWSTPNKISGSLPENTNELLERVEKLERKLTKVMSSLGIEDED